MAWKVLRGGEMDLQAGSIRQRRGRRASVPERSLGSPAPGEATWLALLAATSVGVNACTVQAEVVAEDLPREYGTCRLVVHSYAREHLSGEGIPDAAARPNGSAQRSVTADELRQGVRVSLVELEPRNGPAVLVAWVELGDADLEFGGFEARPSPRAPRGLGELRSDDARLAGQVVLRATG